MRQRISLRRAQWRLLTRLLTIVFTIALIYGGAMVALLALKLHPGDIDRISGYRTAYHWLAGLDRSNFTTPVSLVAGFGGLFVFLVFASLTLQSLPRPYLTRTEVGLPEPSERGATIVGPRAVERVAEVAAQFNDHVMGVTGRLGDGELHVDVGLDDAPSLIDTLEDVRSRVREQLRRHEIPLIPVNVTLTGYERPTRRDPS